MTQAMNENYTEEEKVAFRKGFLFGLYDEDGPRYPERLVEVNPHPVGSKEHEAWKEGYYNNL